MCIRDRGKCLPPMSGGVTCLATYARMEARGGEGGSSQHRHALRLHGCASSVRDQGASALQGGSCGCCHG
eukprot:1498332-Prorocentrum_lima.AAC.1